MLRGATTRMRQAVQQSVDESSERIPQGGCLRSGRTRGQRPAAGTPWPAPARASIAAARRLIISRNDTHEAEFARCYMGVARAPRDTRAGDATGPSGWARSDTALHRMAPGPRTELILPLRGRMPARHAHPTCPSLSPRTRTMRVLRAGITPQLRLDKRSCKSACCSRRSGERAPVTLMNAAPPSSRLRLQSSGTETGPVLNMTTKLQVRAERPVTDARRFTPGRGQRLPSNGLT